MGKDNGAEMKIPALVLVLFSISFAQSDPGSFARIGLNAEGMSLGNSISALTSGNVYTYYNPAVASFQNGGSVSAWWLFCHWIDN